MKKWKICTQSRRKDIFFIMQRHFLKKTLIEKPFDEFIQGKEDRYWINQRIKEGKNFCMIRQLM